MGKKISTPKKKRKKIKQPDLQRELGTCLRLQQRRLRLGPCHPFDRYNGATLHPFQEILLRRPLAISPPSFTPLVLVQMTDCCFLFSLQMFTGGRSPPPRKSQCLQSRLVRKPCQIYESLQCQNHPIVWIPYCFWWWKINWLWPDLRRRCCSHEI